jgi:hypothetical protein
MRTIYCGLVVGGLVLTSCGGDRRERNDHGGTMGHMDSGNMDRGGMNMPGMQMTPQMRAHMDSMMRMSPQQMQAMMTKHQAMMSQMLDGMGSDMRRMNMSGDREWTALTDSVKQDLAELPDLKEPQLSAKMHGHADRVKRLITLHEKMMTSRANSSARIREAE